MESTAVSARAALAGAARIVVKIGSNLVATREGAVNTLLLEGIAAELAALVREGREVLLVTSGAVRLGLARMNLLDGPRPDLSTRQAAAAVGQVALIAAYNSFFSASARIFSSARMISGGWAAGRDDSRVHNPRDSQQHDDHAPYIALPLWGREGRCDPFRGAHAEAGAVMRISFTGGQE